MYVNDVMYLSMYNNVLYVFLKVRDYTSHVKIKLVHSIRLMTLVDKIRTMIIFLYEEIYFACFSHV